LGLPPGHVTRCVEAIAEDGAFGRCTYEEWCARLRASTGMSQADFEEYMAAFWNIYMGNPNEELIAYFRGLRPRYRTAILTNSFVGAREQEEARFSFSSMTDVAIYSHEEGMRKPDPRFFALASERLGIPPAEIVYLDDRQDFVDAARACGFQAVLFISTPQAIADIEALLRGCLADHRPFRGTELAAYNGDEGAVRDHMRGTERRAGQNASRHRRADAGDRAARGD
jgi:putative hydrolase of the HAD superfamily